MLRHRAAAAAALLCIAPATAAPLFNVPPTSMMPTLGSAVLGLVQGIIATPRLTPDRAERLAGFSSAR